MYFYIGLYHIWWYVQLLPWPGIDRIFQSIICSVVGYWFMRITGYKRFWIRKRPRKQKNKEKRVAALSGGAESFFHH